MAAVINLKVKSDFATASADLKRFGTITESQRKKIEKFQKSFKDQSTDRFIDRTNRATAAIRATRGPVDALTSEYKAYQRQIESLIKKGLDPESAQIRKLQSRYKELAGDIAKANKAKEKSAKKSVTMKGALIAVGFAAVQMGKKLVGAFVDFVKASAEAASQAEEIEGKFNVVFAAISEDATEASKTIAKDFDLAASTVNKLLGDTGDILTGLGFSSEEALKMAEQVAVLGLDLASFTNFAGGAEGATAALTKALLGEAESVKALGIVIRQDTKEYKEMVAGIMETTGATKTQAKAQAALNISLEQSKNSIGDYARTSTSAANVTKTLAETIKTSKEITGDYVNNAVTPMKAGLTKLITKLNDAKEAQIGFHLAIKAGTATDEFIENGKGLNKAIEDMITASLLYQRTTTLTVRTLVDGFGVSKLKALELIQSYGELDAAGERMLEHQLQLQEKVGVVEFNRQKAAERAAEDAELKIEQGKITMRAEEALLDLQKSRLTESEKELLAIQEQIDLYSLYEGVAGVQELLNQLYVERNALQLAAKEALIADNIEKEKALELAREELEIVPRISNAYMAQQAVKQATAAADSAAAKKKAEDDTKAAKNLTKLQKKYIDIGATVQGFIAGPLNDLGKAMVSGGESWKGLAKTGIGAVAALLNSLGKLAVTQSAIKFASGNLIAGALYATAATGAFVASGAVAASADSFQTGTGSNSFTVPESPASSRADSQSIAVSPGENVDVTPRGESKTQQITTILNGEPIIDFINEKIESQDIRITADNIQGGLVVA